MVNIKGGGLVIIPIIWSAHCQLLQSIKVKEQAINKVVEDRNYQIIGNLNIF